MVFAGKVRAQGVDRPLERAQLTMAVDDLGPAASVGDTAGRIGISAAASSRRVRNSDEVVVAALDGRATSVPADDDPGPRGRGGAAASGATRRRLRSAVPPVAAMAALLPLGVSPPAAAEALPTTSTVLTISPLWPVVPLNGALGGSLCEANTCTSVPYVPFWTADGVRALDSRLSTTTGVGVPADTATVVFAFSNGALVASDWMAEHADDPGAPTPDELSFVLIGNPRRAHGGSLPAMPPTDYHVIDIVRQYDPKADFPDHPNLLALANIATGILSPLHLDYTGVDLDDPSNVVWTEGNTTYVFVPTEDLPLLAPLRMMGLGRLADALNAPLKEIVEQAYDRPYLTATAVPDAPPADHDAAIETVAAAVPDDTATKPVVRKKKAARTTAATAEATDGDTASGEGDTASGDATSTPPAAEHEPEEPDAAQQPAAEAQQPADRPAGDADESRDTTSRAAEDRPAERRSRHRAE